MTAAIDASSRVRVSDSPGTRWVSAAVLALLPVAATATLLWAAGQPWTAVRAPGAATVDQWVALGAAAGCGLLLAAAALGSLLTLLAALVGSARVRAGHAQRELAQRLDAWACLVTPAVVRRLVGLALGVTLAGAGATIEATPGAAAVPRPPAAVAGSASPAPAGPRTLLPGWTADRPAAAPHRPAPGSHVAPVTPRRTRTGTGVHLVSPGHGRRPEHDVVVHRGDTLWDIAARSLGPGASVAEVAAEWPRWWEANRTTIGADPGLLLPGQRLSRPVAHRHP